MTTPKTLSRNGLPLAVASSASVVSVDFEGRRGAPQPSSSELFAPILYDNGPAPTPLGSVSLIDLEAEFARTHGGEDLLHEARVALADDFRNDGSLLAAARLERGLSQSALAVLIGKTQAAVSEYEGGKRQPELQTAKKMADVLAVTLDELYRIFPAAAKI